MKVQQISFTAVSLAMIVALQFTGLPKPITGLAVNATFLLLCKRAGLQAAIMLAMATPIVAIISGHLPPVLMPLSIPIGAGNIVFVMLLAWTKNSNLLIRTLAPTLAKTATITCGAFFLWHIFSLPPELSKLLAFICALQLFTAGGGILLGEFFESRLPRSIMAE